MQYKLFDKKVLEDLKLKAYSSSRKRSHYNIHTSYNESVQKVLICLLKDTYIPPHFHKYSHQSELFIVVKGSIKVIIFDKNGNCENIFFLGEKYNDSLIEIYPNTIHSVLCESDEAFILEVKEGPFLENDCKEFPSWVISENDNRSKDFLTVLKNIKNNKNFMYK